MYLDALFALRAMAEQQGGLFSLRQARGAGVDRRTLEHWRGRGWVRQLRSGVYAFAGAPQSPWTPAVAAALAMGPDGVLSHRTAAAIHRFPGLLAPALPEMTVPAGNAHRLQDVVIHRTGPIDARDQITRRGVQVTAPARTVVDLAAGCSPLLLGRILDEGAVRRQFTFAEVLDSLDRQPRRRVGASVLRRLLAYRAGEESPDSPLEQRVIRDLAPLRPFEVHYELVLPDTMTVLDAAWPWWRVGVEIDGRSYRTTSRTAHDRESRKLTALAATDWRIGHLTSTMSARACLDAVLSLMPSEAFPELRRDLALR